ncbi:MAG TPA: hypothetical protein QGI71_11580 [Dehalococcoidia bacterium]|nr:hypothetical protein [Dehalococcoidia bacterium]
MLFKRSFHAGLRDGSTTLTFRRWKRPQMKVGGHYHFSGDDALEMTTLDRVAAKAISDGDARRSGFADASALLAELARAGGEAPSPSDEVFRVEFHHVRETDDRNALAASDELTAADRDGIALRLARMDGRSKRGPWTEQTLALIRKSPRCAASRLAPQLDMETAPFKVNVRKLKSMGLTISHALGTSSRLVASRTWRCEGPDGGVNGRARPVLVDTVIGHC